MIRALWTAASGMSAQQLNVDTIANNLANVNTTGFKRQRVDYQDLFYQTLREPGTEEGHSQRPGSGHGHLPGGHPKNICVRRPGTDRHASGLGH
jgi:flagellar basal-body rod protein FlgG